MSAGVLTRSSDRAEGVSSFIAFSDLGPSGPSGVALLDVVASVSTRAFLFLRR